MRGKKIPGSLFKKAGTTHYYMRFKDAAGIWRNQSTGTADLAEAQLALQQEQHDTLAAVVGPKAAHAVAVTRLTDEDVVSPTVAELMQWWLARPSRKHGVLPSESTVASVTTHIIDAPFGRYMASELEGRNVDEWLRALRAPAPEGCGLALSTTKWLRGLLSAAYTAAIRANWPAPRWFYANPVYASAPPQADLTDEAATLDDYPVLEQDEIAPVLMALPPEERGLYATAIYTGLRQGELFALRWADVDFERGKILVRRSHKQHTTKGRTTRAVPINSDLAAWLHAARAADAGAEGEPASMWVFPDPRTGAQRRGGAKYCAILRRALIESFVADPETADGARKLGITFHDLRHTTASLLISAGASLSEVQQYLGHSNPELTARIYVHLSKDHLARVGQLLEGKFGGAADAAVVQSVNTVEAESNG